MRSGSRCVIRGDERSRMMSSAVGQGRLPHGSNGGWSCKCQYMPDSVREVAVAACRSEMGSDPNSKAIAMEYN